MAYRINKNSYLSITSLLQSGEEVFWDTPNFPEIEPQAGDTFVEVTSEYVNRLDLVAFDVYKDVDLWWVIALANDIDLIPTDIQLGMKLRIPQKSYVDSIISRGPKVVV